MKIQKKINEKKIIKITGIKKPFLFINVIDNIVVGKSGRGIYNVNLKSKLLKSHFKDKKVLPATIQIEMMLQTIVSVVYLNKEFKFKRCIIASTSNKFYAPVITSGKIYAEIRIIKHSNLGFKAKAVIFKNKKKISEGDFDFFNSNQI
tara:strand:+ start:124 stop:567 length:444 start_codon:yes stop_codon:yes gene_type:complete